MDHCVSHIFTVCAGRFNDSTSGGYAHGALADVIPFTHVGGWPGDPSWMAAGVVVPWEVAVKTGEFESVV